MEVNVKINAKKIKLIGLILFFTLIMLMIMPSKVNAAENVYAVLGKEYTKGWDNYTANSNRTLVYDNSITLSERGILKMDFTKPIDSYEKYGGLSISVYDENYELIWDTTTYSDKDSVSPRYTYYVGLNKGTYHVMVKPQFNVTYGKIDITYKFTLAKTNYAEIESNETKGTATKLTLNKMYQGYLGGSPDKAENSDYYKISLTKGRNYKLILRDYDKLDASTCIENIYDADGKYVLFNLKIAENGDRYYEFTAGKTGDYYIRFYNYRQKQLSYKVGVYEVKKDINSTTISLNASAYGYTGKDIKPTVTVKDGTTTLKSGTDYKVTFSNNKNVGVGTVKIEGKGNYQGTKTKTFKIVNNIKNASISLNASTYNYTGKSIKPTVTVKYNGKALKSGTDYKVTFVNNINPGTATVKVEGKGNYAGTISKTFKIELKKTTGVSVDKRSSSYIKLKWTKDTAADKYEVYMATSQNGKYEKIGTTYSNNYTKYDLKSGKTYYFKVRAVKRINGKESYGRYSNAFATITSPKTPTISNLTEGSRKITVKWEKDTSVTGYEVYMATNVSGTYSKIATITKNTTTTYTKTNLTKERWYYFKVRSYKTLNGQKIYSDYSYIGMGKTR